MEYRKDIDVLKGYAIIAVILFHCGLLRSGYLGVDAFFVINGFFIVPSVIGGIHENRFSYFDFLKKKIVRLFPLVLILCASSLFLGCIFMLPFELERTARSAIACCFMSENLRSAFTYGDYWVILNDYSPLFHLWYVGILFEFYLVYPLLLLIIGKFFKKGKDKAMLFLTLILFFSSLVLYLLPFDNSLKFYLLPFRLFEIISGGLVAIILKNTCLLSHITNLKHINLIKSFILISLLFIIFSSLLTVFQDGIGHQVRPDSAYSIGLTTEGLHFSPVVLLLLTVLLSSLYLIKAFENKCLNWGLSDGLGGVNSLLSNIGKRSYSLFIWHQFVLAFYRNIIDDDITLLSVTIYLLITGFLSELTYQYVEKRITPCKKSLCICLIIAFVLILPSSYIYVNGGVINNIPELEMKKGDGYRNITVAYVDIPYQYEYKTFPNNGKKNILVVGNSFARDFCNIIMESEYKDKFNFSMCRDRYPKEIVTDADYIFSFLPKESITDSIRIMIKKDCKIYGIGTKNFGKSNNQYYSRRWLPNYFNSVSILPKEYKMANEEAKKHWGDAYIDLIKLAMVDSVHVRVFTPDRKYISQDCRHLTPAGAKWYASVIDWNAIFDNEE